MNTLKVIFTIMLIFPALVDAQFRTRNRIDHLEGFDEQRFSWGFFIGGNYYDYKTILDPNTGLTNEGVNVVKVKGYAGFGAGLIGKMRLHQNLDLRLEPSLQFVQREIYFGKKIGINTISHLPINIDDRARTIKSTYLDVPLLLDFHGDRWYNSRPYVAGGVNYLVNLQSNQDSQEDNANNVFRSTTHNFGWSIEAGIQFYFRRFKLTPAFRGTFFFNNELVPDKPTTYGFSDKISSMSSRAFMFVLKFE